MIRTIYVKNFKCFEKISVECRLLDLFTGINGMGKSTIIQALLLLRQTSEMVVPGRGELCNTEWKICQPWNASRYFLLV